MNKRIALYPGSFDPFTMGHLDIVERAAKLFDEVIVTIAENSRKAPLFNLEERIDLISNATKHIHNVRCDHFEGLLVEFAHRMEAIAIIRGLRAVSDFEYEFQMALMNRRLQPDISTVFLMPNEKYSYINSTIVKEVARYGGNIEKFVTKYVAEKLKEKFK
jgi:pantetheine-phosphate adenylyltransferase